MRINIDQTNNLFHANIINSRVNKEAAGEQQTIFSFLRRDVATISPQGKAMSAVEGLMKQKEFLQDCRDSLLKQQLEQGECTVDIQKKLEEYEEQLEALDEQIIKEMSKQPETAFPENGNAGQGNRTMTRQEADNQTMSSLISMSSSLEQAQTMHSVKNRMEGEKNVLEAEIKKDGDKALESKKERVAEIEDRTAQLTEMISAKMNEVAEKAEDVAEGTVIVEEEETKTEEEMAKAKEEVPIADTEIAGEKPEDTVMAEE